MAAVDTGSRIRITIVKTIQKHCFGEDVAFDVFPGIEVQNGAPVITYTMTFTKRSPIIGQGKMLNVSRINGADPTDAAVAEAVTTALTQLRELGEKLLASPN
ncbi:MAG: hypothetical protein ACRDP5_17685 [Streptosporangiaceae bacterium]